MIISCMVLLGDYFAVASKSKPRLLFGFLLPAFTSEVTAGFVKTELASIGRLWSIAGDLALPLEKPRLNILQAIAVSLNLAPGEGNIYARQPFF